MSENYKRLDAVQEEIKDLLKNRTSIKEKEEKEEITRLEEIEQEGLTDLLAEFEGVKKYWQGEVSKENSQKKLLNRLKKLMLNGLQVSLVDYKYRE